ncbi:hypothetical protein L6164_023209 [Bauhinia variegata]|uniref:Uncharacterized protein n=1 Tax=Bauhinia variegata TaxID=167791 RepID=A0ACB9MHY9_BAUVA|nr:hypothetical protein L6164_023209 [Bauhinia variegata]
MIQFISSTIAGEMWTDPSASSVSPLLQTNWYDILGRKTISNPTEVNATENYMRSLIRIATMTSQLYAMGEFSLSNGEKRYGLVQCTRYLGDEKCAQCLEDLLERVHECCAQKLGWQFLFLGCMMKYEDYMFYTANGQTTPSPPMPDSTTANQGGTNKSKTLVMSITSASVAVALLSCSIYYYLRRTRGKEETIPIIFPVNAQSENSYEDLPAVPFITIQESTNNFSEACKLGEGGFGVVYKGNLPDGRQIAVKRLSKTSSQEHGQSLLVYTWKLLCGGKSLELMDSTLESSYITDEVTRCIHIGLLCVQEDAADRPTMSGVVVMLGSDTMTLPLPNRPAFSVGRMALREESRSKNSKDPSINDVTVSLIAPR